MYVSAAFLALLVLSLWPHNTSRLLVFVAPAQMPFDQGLESDQLSSVDAGPADATFYAVAANTQTRLLTKVGANGYVIAVPRGAGGAVVQQLYRNGAFLVLNAANLGGCGETGDQAVFRSTPL